MVAEATGPMPRHGRPWAVGPWVLAVLVLLHVGLAWWGRQPAVLTGQDDAEYIVLSSSLRSGSYRNEFLVDAPVHTQYPPGYPAMLAVWSALFGERFAGLVALSVLLSVGTLVVLYVALRGRFGDAVALAAVAVVAVNPEVIAYAGTVMSEAAYGFLAVASLALAGGGSGRRNRLVAAAAAAIGAVMTRSVGVTLVAALAAHWLLERRWRPLVGLTLVAVLAVGGWLWWSAQAPEQYMGSSYVAELRSIEGGQPWLAPLPRRIVDQAAWYGRVAVPWTLAVPTVAGTVADNVLWGIAFLVLGSAGLVVLWSRWRPVALYLLAYACLLMAWVWAVERFLVPVVPLVVAVLLVGCGAVVRRFRPGWSTGAVLALAAVLFASGSARSLEHVRERVACGPVDGMPPDECLTPDQASFFAALRHVRRELPEDAVLLTAKTGALYLYTGRRAVDFDGALARTGADLLTYLRDGGATHVLLSDLWAAERERLAPRLGEVCGSLALVAAFPAGTYLFRIGSAPSVAGEAACSAVAAYLRRDDGTGT